MFDADFKKMALAAFIGAFLIPTIIMLILTFFLYLIASLLDSGSSGNSSTKTGK